LDTIRWVVRANGASAGRQPQPWKEQLQDESSRGCGSWGLKTGRYNVCDGERPSARMS
jgi:hypothetical protein